MRKQGIISAEETATGGVPDWRATGKERGGNKRW